MFCIRGKYGIKSSFTKIHIQAFKRDLNLLNTSQYEIHVVFMVRDVHWSKTFMLFNLFYILVVKKNITDKTPHKSKCLLQRSLLNSVIVNHVVAPNLHQWSFENLSLNSLTFKMNFTCYILFADDLTIWSRQLYLWDIWTHIDLRVQAEIYLYFLKFKLEQI